MKISQREAHRLRTRVSQLEDHLRQQKNAWSGDFGSGWVNIDNISLTPESYAKVSVARKLGHAVILVPGDYHTVLLYAAKL